MRSTRFSILLSILPSLLLFSLGFTASPSFAEDEGLESEPGSWWSDARWKYSTGFDYSRGDFGLDEDTVYYYVPLSIEADFFPVRAKITIPLLSVDGPSGVLVDSEADGSSSRETGLGQIVASVGYLWVPPSTAIPYLEMTGKVTLPTETSNDLGNGEWAFAIQADVFKRFGELTIFGTFGRKLYTGSSPDDRFYASGGASVGVHSRVELGVAYDWYEANVDSVRDTHQISPFVGIKVDRHWSVGPYGLIGLSEGAPDYGVGFSLSWRP